MRLFETHCICSWFYEWCTQFWTALSRSKLHINCDLCFPLVVNLNLMYNFECYRPITSLIYYHLIFDVSVLSLSILRCTWIISILNNLPHIYCSTLTVTSFVVLFISCSVFVVLWRYSFAFDECCGVRMCREGPRGLWRRAQVVFRGVLRDYTQPHSRPSRLGRVVT